MGNIGLFLFIIIILSCLMIIRLITILPWKRFLYMHLKNDLKTITDKKHLCCVLGSGGHTSEMIKLLKIIEKESNNKYFKQKTFIKADTDTYSHLHVEKIIENPIIHSIPRSREVGQSYISSIMSTLFAFIVSLKKMYAIRPDVLFVNGPGTCLPIVVAAFVLKFFGINRKVKIVFVESFCRVKTLSLTGILLYPIVDLFVVQWPENLRYAVMYYGNLFL
eukprot:TRINITY_DN78_c0_g1_i1.p1 TRINITY_DN78_c0_g1~~TRINITY_DN78_c0_g1_i1.p1  ORF type:complete len:220 (+),score=44.75 TRINITY_DN78_c0_g1_i1:59-718(+)